MITLAKLESPFVLHAGRPVKGMERLVPSLSKTESLLYTGVAYYCLYWRELLTRGPGNLFKVESSNSTIIEFMWSLTGKFYQYITIAVALSD